MSFSYNIENIFYNLNKEYLDLGKQCFLINDKSMMLQSGIGEDQKTLVFFVKFKFYILASSVIPAKHISV